VIPFVREGTCEECGRRYAVAGASINPGTETEAPAGSAAGAAGLT
jgi:hypothetical protein